ncbi:MAG: adenosylcobinamide-GDP ribazoletransferase [Dehalococcoidia bacterium]
MTAHPLVALEFLTRIGVRRTPRGDMRRVAESQLWFPAIGLLMGLTLLGVDRLAMRALPQASVDVLLVVALVALTGALHLDGLADAADGLLGGYTPERRLEIMRDVHAGTYAIVAVVCVLALKWAGFAASSPEVRVEAIVLAPCLARFAMLVAIVAFPYARAEGASVAFRREAWPAQFAVAAATAIVAAVVLLGGGGLYVVAFAAGVALAFGALATRMTGGMTGDMYGATVEISEALVLLFIAALASRGWLDAWALG